MALSLFASALPKALRAAPKKSSSLPRRRFCTAKPKGEVAKDGDISTMVMPTRVFLPSPLMRSRLPDTPVYDSPEEIAKEGALTVQQKQGAFDAEPNVGPHSFHTTHDSH